MTDMDIYVAEFLREYLVARGTQMAPLFAYADGSVMLRREFDSLLKRLLLFSGLTLRSSRVTVSELGQRHQLR